MCRNNMFFFIQTFFQFPLNYLNRDIIAKMKEMNEATARRNLTNSLTAPGRGQAFQLSAHPLNMLKSIPKTK